MAIRKLHVGRLFDDGLGLFDEGGWLVMSLNEADLELIRKDPKGWSDRFQCGETWQIVEPVETKL